MNKKFSTLVASALLATAFSANAQTAGTLQVKAVADKIETGTPTRYYVLNTTTVAASDFADATGKALTMDADGAVTVADATMAAVNDQLWTIKVTAVAGSNRFILTNAKTGATLSFDPKYAVVAAADGKVTPPATTDAAYQLSGNDTEWSWVSAPNAPAADLQAVETLTAAFRTDSTMALAATTTGEVFAYKYANNVAAALQNGATQVEVQALIPGAKALKAADLNVLGEAPAATYFTLESGVKDLVGDIFTGKKFHAEDAATANSVKLNLIGSDSKVSGRYAYVDTAFHVATGLNEAKLYKLAINNKKDETDYLADKAMEFFIVRDLFKDSLSVSVAKEALMEEGAADANGSKWTTPQSDPTMQTYLNVSAIKLTDKTSVFTLFEDGATNLVFAGNAVTVNDLRTSVEDGLYYIMNSKGQYMTSLIHQNGTRAEWATIKADEQNVDHMPAFQWVMLKENTYSDQAKKVSKMKATNREFAGTDFSYQLYQAPGATYMYTAGSSDSLKLVKITDTKILGDTLLGYKDLTDKELIVNAYTFNYLHPYATDKFIAKSTKDSVLNVLDGVTAFSLEKGENVAYGYDVEDANGRIEGLKQLYRANYKMYVPSVNGKVYVSRAKENKYALSSHYAAVDSFYFKENNQIGEKCYHAMVKANVHELAEFKAGVADDDQAAILKEQVLDETRTSSFYIAPYDAPLYRRFNTTLEGAVAGDGADTVRFVEQYRKEYLQIEGNKNFTHKGIDFLGIYTDDKAPSGLSFIVDTAWLNRGAGQIKPQYLISIERTDKLPTPGLDCTESGKHYDKYGKETDAAHCVHATPATPGFDFGKYLVNFEDSVAVEGNEDIYAWKKYTRAGFVKAAHVGDSLYILNGMFADVTVANFDTATINAAVKDKKYAAKYIVNLKGDNHKLVTWSFRYVDPAKAATDNKTFLIESMATDGRDIAPVTANWLKMQNGCLVLSDDNSEFNVFTQNDDALIFDVEYKANDEVATDNENVSTSTVSVIAGNGSVAIKGAAGKTVTISNILGQTIANTVLSSDDATIAAPAGVVVVAIEGEAAVKAIVK
ncbi:MULTISPECIES: DUF6383 domain-containing protein [Parabacteroides]|uniref:DUF6383 domain-containing protein n=1 Tax=Parabacteroides leei TaxID=2939491 RepID=UPI0018988DE6|nr:DUF6383 domain-containing protein [Parabacteroides goldsteinii]